MRKKYRLIIYLVVTIGAFIMIFPFLWMVLTSLKSTEEVFAWPPTIFPKSLTLFGYIDTTRIWNIPRYYLNTLIVATAVTGATLFLCSLAGYAFAHLRFPYKNALFVLILSSLMLPFQVRMISTYLLLDQFGWINTYHGLVVPWCATAFGIFLMRQVMASIPRALFDIARIDGCPEFSLYWRIALPSSSSGLAALGILTFMGMWNEFLWPMIMVSDESMKTLPLLIASMSGGEHGQWGVPWPTRMAGSTMVILPIIIAYIFIQKSIMKAFNLQSGIK